MEYIHKHKTGKLLEFAVLAGAILSDATEEQEEKLLTFAKYIGLAFQIRDDILDVEGTEEEIENRLVAIFLMKRAHIQRCLL